MLIASGIGPDVLEHTERSLHDSLSYGDKRVSTCLIFDIPTDRYHSISEITTSRVSLKLMNYLVTGTGIAYSELAIHLVRFV